MTVTTDRPRPPETHEGKSMTEYLQAPECEVDIKFRTYLLRVLLHHNVEIRGYGEFAAFCDDHGEYFRPITAEESAQGLDTTRTVWQKYHGWITPAWEQRSITGEVTWHSAH